MLSARTTAAALLLVSLTAVRLSAQDASGDSAATRADTVRLAPVVVTATRVPLRLPVQTAGVTVLAGAELRARGIVTVAQALRETPGAAIVQSGSAGGVTSLFLRGGESRYAKVLVDGIPVNQPGGAIDLATLTTDNVERIEIVRGPVSVLYGSDAMTGVVQIFTRRGDGPATPQLSVRGGSYGSFDGDVGVHGGSTRLGYSLDAAHHRTAGIYGDSLVSAGPVERRIDNSFRNTVLSGALRAAPDSLTDARLTARYTDGRYHFPTDGNGAVNPFQNAFTQNRQTLVGLDAGRRLLARLEGRVALTANEQRVDAADLPTSAADTSRFYRQSSDQYYRRAADARANFFATSHQAVTVGTEYAMQGQRTSGSSVFGRGALAPSPTADASRHNVAGYAQWIGGVADALSYTLSGRIDDNSRFGTFTTGRAALGYAFATGTRLRASAGNAFKEPDFAQNTINAPYSLPNRDLRPERSLAYEAGAEQSLAGGRVLVSAAYFDQRFRDLIQYRGIRKGAPRADSSNYVNVAAATARGAEFGATLRALPALEITGSYTRLRTRVTNPGTASTFAAGKSLIRRPDRSASGTARFFLPAAATLAVTTTYVGARDDYDFANFPFTRVRLGGYATSDLSAELPVARAGAYRVPVTLTFRGENIFDRTYEPVRGYRPLGRTLFVGARVGR